MPFIPAAIGAVAAGAGTIIGAAAPILTAAAPGLLSFAAQSMMSKKMQSQQSSSGAAAPQVTPLPAPPTTEKAKVVADESIKNKRIAISRNKTIFTDPLGLTDEQKSGLSLKTLTGV